MWFEMLKLEDSKLIGFWNDKDDNYPQYSMPVPNKPNYDKAKMIEYLSHPYSAVVIKYQGPSHCRLCKDNFYRKDKDSGSYNVKYPMGTKTFSDGVHMYPEGLKHYIEIHEIELPEHFVSHVESHDYDPIKSWADRLNSSEATAKHWIEMSDGPNEIYKVLDQVVRTGSNLEDVKFGGEAR